MMDARCFRFSLGRATDHNNKGFPLSRINTNTILIPYCPLVDDFASPFWAREGNQQFAIIDVIMTVCVYARD